MCKNILIISIISLLLIFGCAKKEREIIKINDIGITLEEFEAAFKSSSVADEGETKRKEFLDIFISRKLMLEEAERLGLDKDSKFLQNVQLFWEQSLLKLVLAKKMNELSLVINVDDKEVIDFYDKLKERQVVDKELSEIYDQIKLIIFKEKQNRAIQNWVASLKEKAKIKIDYQGLGIKEDE